MLLPVRSVEIVLRASDHHFAAPAIFRGQYLILGFQSARICPEDRADGAGGGGGPDFVPGVYSMRALIYGEIIGSRLRLCFTSPQSVGPIRSPRVPEWENARPRNREPHFLCEWSVSVFPNLTACPC